MLTSSNRQRLSKTESQQFVEQQHLMIGISLKESGTALAGNSANYAEREPAGSTRVLAERALCDLHQAGRCLLDDVIKSSAINLSYGRGRYCHGTYEESYALGENRGCLL